MPKRPAPSPRLSHGELLQFKRWNTPTIYNGLEQTTRHDRRTLVNLEECRDFMPQLGPMVGYALTVQFEPGNRRHQQRRPNGWAEYRRYVAEAGPGPWIVVVQDLDKPRCYGAFWGEVTSNFHRALGCVGTIIDGAIRDLDEMHNAGFKALARRLAVSHCFAVPVRWGRPVEVFGVKIRPGQLIHADKHGFLLIPPGEEHGLLDAARFMDANECNTMIATARAAAGLTRAEIADRLDQAADAFTRAAVARFGQRGEW